MKIMSNVSLTNLGDRGSDSADNDNVVGRVNQKPRSTERGNRVCDVLDSRSHVYRAVP